MNMFSRTVAALGAKPNNLEPTVFVDAMGGRDEDKRSGFVNAETRGMMRARAGASHFASEPWKASSQATDVDGP
jgi:hypothetical protein